ncbi:MAG: signal recognition particle subunit SRP19/SEC65 family protein [Thermoplasmata archaeon]|nr:signal recognition particle subunit SRP19/SEC65 family protein [Thermoplasmata archaeon]MCI4361690.1 signal recognition particle subunit SRP19/SEC65 family protein [Thermoplasmata archaeon]
MPDHFFVYPAYVSRGTTRALGRRVAQPVAVAETTLEEIVEVAQSLGFTATSEPDKQYPRAVHAYAGRVRIAKKAGVTKTAFLRQLATALSQRHAEGGKR